MSSNTVQTTKSVLLDFDHYPNSYQVRLPVVKALYACSSATVWRAVKDGHIPKPHKLTKGTTSWNVGELRQSLATKNSQGANDE